jgi:hypothetical protein
VVVDEHSGFFLLFILEPLVGPFQVDEFHKEVIFCRFEGGALIGEPVEKSLKSSHGVGVELDAGYFVPHEHFHGVGDTLLATFELGDVPDILLDVGRLAELFDVLAVEVGRKNLEGLGEELLLEAILEHLQQTALYLIDFPDFAIGDLSPDAPEQTMHL